MGVYEYLIKNKFLNENEDGSVTVNRQQLDNVINSRPPQQPMWQQINDMTNSMNNKINETVNENMKILPTFIQEQVKPFQNSFTSMTLEQKKRFVDNQQAELVKKVSDTFSRPLWEQIQDFANDTGRTIENTWLGTKHGIEDSGNYINSMLNGEKTQREKELTRVLFSDLSNEQKQMYLAQNSPLGLLLNEQSSEDIAKTINDSVLPIKIDANKIEEARNMYKSMLPINLTDENLNTMRQYIKDNYDKDKVEKIAKTDVKAEERQKENEKIAQNIEEQTNPVAKKLAEVAPSVGQMLPGMALSTVNPALGTTYFITSAGGGYLQDAKNRGMDEAQSKIYATAMGIMEGLTEKLSVGNLKKAGKAMKTAMTAGKGIVKEEAKQIATNSIKDAIKNYGIGIAENTIQEAIMEPIQETMAGLVADKADWDNMPQRMLDSGINGGIVAVITGGGEIGINSCVAVMNKIQNGEVPTQQEIKIAYDDYAKAVGEEKAQNDFKEGAKNAISAQNQQTTIENKPSNAQEQQITLPVQENVSNQNVVTNNQENIKQQQYNIIKETNPMLDDYHTGIRNENDIKTFAEVIDDDESFVYGDFSKEDAEKALKNGKVTIYSSKPIEQGSFVSTSQNMAKDYAGNGKVYSQEVDLNDVAWINGDEGQYAKVDSLANNSKKVYNIINKSLTNNERAQVESEVRRWRINQDDGVGYIDLSDKGYKSYIYNKQGTNVETLLKVNGSEEFRNFIRKGIEDGTYKKSTDINGWASNAKLQYKNNSNVNDVLPNRGNSQTISGLYDTTSGQQTGNNRTETIEQSSGNESVKNSNQSSFNLPQKEEVNLPTKGEEINWNKIERPEGKFRKHYQSIIESSNTTAEAKAIAKEMMGTDTYVPESNQKHINDADTRIQYNGADKELTTLSTNVFNGDKRVTAVDIAVGERLIEYYSKIGDKAKLQEAIRATAMAGTQAGQAVQALSLLNHMTPQGQAIWIDRSVNKLNQQMRKQRGKNAPQFDFTAEMEQKILKSENAEQLQKNLNEVYKELGQQVPKSTMEKIDSWRYFSMLANPKTHIRNMVGNLFMAKTQTAKNKVAGAIEGVVSKVNPKMEREHTIIPASKKTKTYAKNDIKNVIDRLGIGENKYTPQTRLQSEQRTFKSNVLENTLGKMFDLNSNLLEVEDNIGLKAGYVKAFSEYITANKIDVDNITDTQLSKARNYAVQQAQEATFHQASSLATLLNQLNNNKGGKFLMDSILPFKKTPINVAKTGFQYSPMQIIKSVTTDLASLRKGNITVNQYIDNMSKGLTGTGIALVGYALADAGILKASGSDDDRKEKYDEAMGKQTYSIQIGDRTYSLDWLAPTGIPLFIGVEANEIMKENEKEKGSKSTDDSAWTKAVDSAKNILDAFTNSMNPMTEMSMLSGLTNSLKSYSTDSSQMFAELGTNMTKSFVNQFIPTALSQIARTTDDYERDTTSTANGMLPKAIDSTINQIKSKIPGLRQTLPTKTDIWGKEVKQEENLPLRALKNSVFPWTEKDISNTSVDKELSSLYGQIGESSIFPKNINKTLTLDKETYRMTNEEYNKYKKDFGNTSYKILENLFDTKEYKGLSNDQKQTAIEKVYAYAKEVNKQNYSKEVSVDVDTTNMYNTMQKLNTKGQSQYITYLAKTTGIDKESEKNKVLLDSDIDNTAKAIIYANTMGKDDKVFNIAQNTMNTNQYLEYKVRSSNDEFKADKDKNGNSISGSAKKKIYNYINSNISGYENRLIMLASQYKLSRAEQQKVVDYINKNSKTNEEVIDKLEKLSQNFQVKDGKVYFK